MVVVMGNGERVLADVKTYCRAIVIKKCDPDGSKIYRYISGHEQGPEANVCI